jgi:hypothetical protein
VAGRLGLKYLSWVVRTPEDLLQSLVTLETAFEISKLAKTNVSLLFFKG